MSKGALERKKRFGVSVPESLAEDLDRLAEALGADRSSLVKEAIRAFVQEHKHHLVPHECTGVLILVVLPGCSGTPSLLREFGDVVQGYSHFHTRGLCIEVVLVSGPSARVKALHAALMKLPGYTVRYVPIAHELLCGPQAPPA